MSKNNNKSFNFPLIILTNKNNEIIDYSKKTSINFPEVLSSEIIDISTITKYNLLSIELKNSRLYLNENHLSTDKLFSSVIDNLYEEIVIIDYTGKVIYCNQRFEKNYGIKAENLIGSDIYSISDNNIIDKLMFEKVISKKIL